MATATSTIVFTDAVGSTALRSRLGEDAADRLFRAHHRSLHDVVVAHGGRVVKSAGDGIMAAFDSATDAVRASVLMQQRVARDLGEVQMRVGVATGDVSWEDGDCFGLPVVVAARLEAAAQGGQILVSSLVRVLAADRSSVEFVAVGPLTLPGLSEPVDGYEVRWSPPLTAVPSRAPCPPSVLAINGSAFVGRRQEQAQLDATWASVSGGEARVVLIGAEAGAGKTRLVFEFARRCAAEGAAVLLGVCDTELALPYQPWVHALDQAIRAMPEEMTRRLAPDLSELSTLLPQLERLIPGLAARRPAADPETERFRLFEAVDAVLAGAAELWPTVVVLDDLHWAAAPTLAMLRHLARSGRADRLLIVGTFRDTGDEITEPLGGCLADLRRTESTVRLHLDGLGTADVEHFVAAAVGHELDGDLRGLAAKLAEHTNGNAFYLGELWRHLVARGAVSQEAGRWTVREPTVEVEVPDGVREVVTSRLTRLSPSAREVVELAAMAGQQVEQRVLRAAAVGPAVETGLDELVDAKLLDEMGGTLPSYQFVHAIARESVAQSVSRSARQRMHLRLADALESVYEADRRPVLARLARHFAEAAAIGDPAKAVYYGRRAALQALRSVAHDEAIRHLQVAVDLQPPVEELADLLVTLGIALAEAGRHDEGVEVLVRAFDTATEAALAHDAARAAAALGNARHTHGRDAAQVIEMVSAALQLLEGLDDEPMTVTLLAVLARALVLDGRQAEGSRVGQQALTRARELGRSDVLIAALQSALIIGQDPARLTREAMELVEVARRTDDGWSQGYALGNAVRTQLDLGEVTAARANARELERVAERCRAVIFIYMARVYQAVFALIDGRFDDAERLAADAQRFGSSVEVDFDAGVHGVQMYVIRREQGRLDEIAPVLQAVARLGGEHHAWAPGLAAAFAEMGMLDNARQVFGELAAARFSTVARDATWPGSLTFLAETCIVLGDRDAAPVLTEAVAEFGGRNLMVGFTICLGPADRLLGGLAALTGNRADAERHFERALALAERSSSPPWQARVQHDWARAVGGRPDLLQAARATAQRLGMIALVRSCDDAVAAAPVLVSVTPSYPDGLSGREVEVLRHVAEGLSNRAIGERLHISPNTAANHVRAILQKTGSANRAEATAYAGRKGLLGDSVDR